MLLGQPPADAPGVGTLRGTCDYIRAHKERGQVGRHDLNTGKHSLNSRIRGEGRALCEQSKEKITPEKMYRRIKEIAMLENGLPSEEKRIKIKKDGVVKVVKY